MKLMLLRGESVEIVIVSHSTVHGGAESYLIRLSQELKQGGDMPVLVGTIPSWAESGLEQVAIDLGPKWAGTTIVSGVVRLKGERRRVKTVVGSLSPDLFHMQFKREQIGFTSVLSGIAPVVWTEHGGFLRGPRGALLAAGYRYAARSTSLIICVSDEVADDVRRVVGRGPRIEVVENSVDTQTLRPPSAEEKARSRLRFGIGADVPVLLWIGRLHHGKRPEFAVDLAKAWSGITLIAGDGPMRASVEDAARDVSSAHLLGYVEDTSALFTAADVMAFTSNGGEGYPTMTMLEAGSHGLPFVTDGESGATQVILESGGEILPRGTNADEWVVALEASISGQRSRAVRSWAENHDVKHWTQQHQSLFESVLGSSNARSKLKRL